MHNSSDIPQYGLRDPIGKPLDFNFMVFGNKTQNYDFEKPHRHDFYEVLVFNEGGGTHDIDFATYPACKHSVHFVASENIHLVLRSKNSSGCNLSFSNGYIPQELIDKLPFSKTNPVLQLNESEFNQITQLIDNVKTEYLAKQEGYETIIRLQMHTLMLHLLRAYTAKHPEEKNPKPELVNLFMKLIQQHYINHYKVEHYARKLNITPKHLIEVCRIHTGKTPLQHIREYTIAEAKKLLYYTQLSVKEIAYRLNFDNPANFSKYFKSATHYTPLEYRGGIG